MNKRIRKLTEKTVRGEMWVDPVPTEYDRTDLFLPPIRMTGKRMCEYIRNQPTVVCPESCFTGLMRFDGSVEGDIFNRVGHKHFRQALDQFYNKPVNNLLIFEWQHSVGDFEKIIRRGLVGIRADIMQSRRQHSNDPDALDFLQTQDDFCDVLIERAHKGAQTAREMAAQTDCAEYRANLLRLADGLQRVPEHPAASFYEAMLCLYFCYPFIPDSIGLIDRYLYPYYQQDMAAGRLDKETAAAYLQELFLMLQARISIKSDRFYRGGESHFCVGGYTENGEDSFNELSRLIVDALMELPTWIPQISLRWTKKTPREVLRYMLDCERKDANKRIAFVNDEPRLKGLMNHTGLSYAEAVRYTMMGCNELALPGGMVLGFDPLNILRSVANTFHQRSTDIRQAETFDAFYAIYEEELFRDLAEADQIGKGFQTIRSRDNHVVSNIFLEGCIENAKSCINGGLERYIAVGLPIGLSNVIDSLSVTKQFVYDQKIVSMDELIAAVQANWNGYETLRALILKKGAFFGNDDDCSNAVAQRFFNSLYQWNSTENYLHKKWLFGNLIGYNEHNKFFGSGTKATPDGRFDGDSTNFGIGQSEGKDRNGLTALLNSVAKCDPHAVLTGPSVTNVLIDAQLVQDDAHFEKMVDLFQTYFQSGGTHFQLTYVAKEDLLCAKEAPEKYRNLRVRVSGFSDYFVFLNDALQDEIILRTVHTQ